MKKQWHDLWDFYQNDYLHWLTITVAAFLILILFSFVVGLFVPAIPQNIAQWFSEGVSGLGVMDESGNFFALPLFLNNTRAMLIGIAMGFIPYAYLTALNLGVNSMLLGFFAALYLDNGYPMAQYFAALFPHAIFELPAMVFAFSCGLYLCHTVTDNIRNNVKGSVKNAVKNIGRVFVMQIIPLLIVAAVLEAYVTPRFLAWVMR